MGRRRRARALAERLAPLGLGAAALALGLVAEARSFAWSDTRHWLPDLGTGLAVLAWSGVAWRRGRGASILLAATGATWFLGNFDPNLLYWHRGPLVHLLLTFPGWRPRARWEQAAVATAYVAALAPVWRSERATVLAAVVLIGLVGLRAWTASAGERRDRDRALTAAALLSGALGAGAVARLAVPSGTLVDPTLLLYEGALVLSTAVLLSGLRRRARTEITDLVVELGEGTSSGLREALAEVLNDPTVEVGYRTPGGGYVDDGGRLVGPAGPGRAATYVQHGGEPVAVLLHDAAVLDDPELAEAVSEATRLATTHAELGIEVRAQLADLADSRRRLVTANDLERQRMRDRLLTGPGRRLNELDATLAATVDRHPEAEHVRSAASHVREAVAELDRLAAGLHPTELAGGLGPALTALAARCPVVVDLDVLVGRLEPAVERAAYFVCAEALTNVVKHARTDRVVVAAQVRDGRLTLTVADQGVGGADPNGAGLLGLADRVETVGGNLRVTSPPVAGTRLTAELPLGRPPA